MNSPKLWLTSHLVTHGVVSKLRIEMAVIRGDLFVTMPGAHASEKLEPDALIASHQLKPIRSTITMIITLLWLL